MYLRWWSALGGFLFSGAAAMQDGSIQVEISSVERWQPTK